MSEMHPTSHRPYICSWAALTTTRVLSVRATRIKATSSSRSHNARCPVYCVIIYSLQMLNIEIFKAPRVGEIDYYERLTIDVAAMTVPHPKPPTFYRNFGHTSPFHTHILNTGAHSSRVLCASVRFYFRGGKKGLLAGDPHD
jgi:hypothetical protein